MIIKNTLQIDQPSPRRRRFSKTKMADKKVNTASDSEVVSKIIADVRRVFLESESEMDLETLARLEKIWISKLTGL